jgi:hypothetical protein
MESKKARKFEGNALQLLEKRKNVLKASGKEEDS